ncbi:MAG: Ribosomal protein S6 modification protein [Microgenomates group bacterium GW2011_GWF2_45_18]|nr:MAG: Ribosomal protein S6 modification protein [Microgenomates group bacterium GW2011_GWF1_44_10]KKU01686.1 MAG: Ribosomal protein S6 modification protein [Microgenomates group bacterium GW2011_GWF2_45_18]OGJ41525.1 MAG: hypothetical protein A2378_00305 [Candidatus Pacebacteria bacterium RIFOXYB1_FULL_44_10]HAU99541.1 hypothetical protein [Candidatus Paceibacterota bacterium]HAX01465.1 hypothetical protein [Candidatus Paceibacterota bacterium]
MKKLLFLVNQQKESYQAFVSAGKKADVEVQVVPSHDVVIQVNDHKNEIFAQQHPLEYYDLVYFRSLIRSPETHMAIVDKCNTLNIPVYDKSVRCQHPYIEGKMFDYMKLSRNAIPLIPSQYLDFNHYAKIAHQFSYPLVVKISNGSQGRGVHLCHNSDEVKTVYSQYSQPLMVQPFIQNDGDLRVFVIGEKAIATIKRKASKKDEFRNNASLGGDASLYQIGPVEEELAIKAVKTLNHSIAGVDLVFDESDQTWKVLEVNRAPQYDALVRVTGIDIPLKMVEFLRDQC